MNFVTSLTALASVGAVSNDVRGSRHDADKSRADAEYQGTTNRLREQNLRLSCVRENFRFASVSQSSYLNTSKH